MTAERNLRQYRDAALRQIAALIAVALLALAISSGGIVPDSDHGSVPIHMGR